VSLSIRVDEEPTHWKLTLLGELDYGECSGFRMNIDRILISDVAAVIIDLSGVTYLDSSALGLLVSLSRGCTQARSALVLITSEQVDKMLRLSGLTQVFAVAAGTEEALALVESPTA
jgi:anti-sigma B factor antagonist